MAVRLNSHGYSTPMITATRNNPLNIDLPKRIADLSRQQAQAISNMLRIEAGVRGLGKTEQDLADAEQRVVKIGQLIATALEPA